MLVSIDRETLEQQTRALLEAGDLDGLRALFAMQHPADIADVIDRLDDEDQLQAFRLLPFEQAAEVLDEASVDTTRELLTRLPADQAGDLLDHLPMDDVAEILSEDVPDQQQALLAAMEQSDADEVRKLLRYPPQSAGRLMTERFVRVTHAMSAAEAMTLLRQVAPEIETLTYLYVLDNNQCLSGIVSLRELITAAPEQRIEAIMHRHLITVSPETDQEEVARLVSQYDFSALPVLDSDRRMLGIITVDDVIDVLLQEGTEDVLRFGGVQSGDGDQPYFTVPIWRTVRKRVVWLLLLFVAGTLTSTVVGLFESELQQVIVLSTFIPLLIGTGGNTGAQTVSTVIRGMALGEIRLRDAWRVILRELSSGLVLGGLLGVIAFVWAQVTGNPSQIALVVGMSVLAICVWANSIAAFVPLVARKLKIDPATVSAPLITTLVDATGLAIYLTIAKIVLHI